ncbi:MAG: manganese efflux pump MntP family protein [Anaerocolumna sp.]
MNYIELVLVSIGLAMDAFAVAICKGLSVRKLTFKHPIIVGLYFGIFQAGMPLIGYILGKQFSDKISSIDHWVAFILLGIIGINMIIESRKKEMQVCCAEVSENVLEFKSMIMLAIATSIDALAVGVTLAFLKVNIYSAISIIGIITFVIVMVGVCIGHAFGCRLKAKAELAGGLLLIALGIKILIEHLWILGN